MTIDSLRDAIASALDCDPRLTFFESRVPGAKGVRLRRYVDRSGRPIGHEHTLTTQQNLWVRRDDVRLSRVGDIPHVLKTANELSDYDSANSNLFAVEAFRNRDLIRFKITDVSQALRVLSEVLG